MNYATRPNLRPEERPEAFDKLAESWWRHFQPTNPESEALVHAITYIQWRIGRYKLDECLIQLHGAHNPGQSHALAVTRAIIQSLEQLGAWTYSSLLFLEHMHNLDASEAMESKALTHNLASFLKLDPDTTTPLPPAPPPPRTKPN